MPVAQSRKRQLAVFVHGFGSSKACWDKLLGLLQKDATISGAFDLTCFEYPTSIINIGLLQRIPRLQEVAQGLSDFLESRDLMPYEDITLVGHSQGGLVIQTCLVNKLQKGQFEHLKRIRQVILIATPNYGSTTVSAARRVMYSFFSNPQERMLRVFNADMSDIVEQIDGRLESAVPGEPNGWPIPIQCFWGTKDDIVLETSARGPFNTASPLDGDHFTILQPDNHGDRRYTGVARALLEPAGHMHVWEVDLYEAKVKVEPLLGGSQDYMARYGDHQRPVKSDNRAEVVRTVAFSPRNRCVRPFSLRYATRRGGFVNPVMSDKNEASSEEKVNYEDYGTEAVFKFTPRAGKIYTLHAEVWKGFDIGSRDIHFHLGRRQTHFQVLRCGLDLTAYLKAGHTLKAGPNLYFHHEDPGHDSMCKQRKLEHPVLCTKSDLAGTWEWEFENIWEGVVDVVWDFEEPGNQP